MTFQEIVERMAMTEKPNTKKVRQKTQRVLPGQQSLSFIEHLLGPDIIPQRPRDGYVNATRLCKTAGKRFGTYYQNQQTKDFIGALSTDVGIPTSGLVQIIKGGNEKLAQGTWVHPQVAIHLAQWLSPEFSVQVTKWVFDWISGNVDHYRPIHLRRFLKNRAKIPYNFFSMLNELYLNLVAPLEDTGIILPDGMMPDISMGRLFSDHLRKHGINPVTFPTYQHEFIDSHRPTVEARLYPIEHLAKFRVYFNEVWLPNKARIYFTERLPEAVSYIGRIEKLPER